MPIAFGCFLQPGKAGYWFSSRYLTRNADIILPDKDNPTDAA